MRLGIENMVGLYKHHDGEEAEITQSFKRLSCVLENRGIEIVQTSFEAYRTFPSVKRPEFEGSSSLLSSKVKVSHDRPRWP